VIAFPPAPGWTLLHPSTEPRTVLAVTAPDARSQQPFLAFTSLRRLRRGGVLIWADASRPDARVGPFPRARLPLRLRDFRVDHGWEGQPVPNVQQRLRWVNVAGWNLEVRVYFGTQHPSRAVLARTQTEIDRLRLP